MQWKITLKKGRKNERITRYTWILAHIQRPCTVTATMHVVRWQQQQQKETVEQIKYKIKQNKTSELLADGTITVGNAEVETELINASQSRWEWNNEKKTNKNRHWNAYHSDTLTLTMTLTNAWSIFSYTHIQIHVDREHRQLTLLRAISISRVSNVKQQHVNDISNYIINKLMRI